MPNYHLTFAIAAADSKLISSIICQAFPFLSVKIPPLHASRRMLQLVQHKCIKAALLTPSLTKLLPSKEGPISHYLSHSGGGGCIHIQIQGLFAMQQSESSLRSVKCEGSRIIEHFSTGNRLNFSMLYIGPP